MAIHMVNDDSSPTPPTSLTASPSPRLKSTSSARSWRLPKKRSRNGPLRVSVMRTTWRTTMSTGSTPFRWRSIEGVGICLSRLMTRSHASLLAPIKRGYIPWILQPSLKLQPHGSRSLAALGAEILCTSPVPICTGTALSTSRLHAPLRRTHPT